MPLPESYFAAVELSKHIFVPSAVQEALKPSLPEAPLNPRRYTECPPAYNDTRIYHVILDGKRFDVATGPYVFDGMTCVIAYILMEGQYILTWHERPDLRKLDPCCSMRMPDPARLLSKLILFSYEEITA